MTSYPPQLQDRRDLDAGARRRGGCGQRHVRGGPCSRYGRSMRVEIWADLVCPWCYLGKRRFEKALVGFAHRADVEIVYRAVDLDPHWPKAETVGQSEMLVDKYGVAAERAAAMQAQLERTAAAEGLEYH